MAATSFHAWPTGLAPAPQAEIPTRPPVLQILGMSASADWWSPAWDRTKLAVTASKTSSRNGAPGVRATTTRYDLRARDARNIAGDGSIPTTRPVGPVTCARWNATTPVP